MQSTTELRLEPVARVLDDALVGEKGHVALYLGPFDPDGEIEIGIRRLGSAHPFAVLAGFSAPEEWTAFGLRASGTVHHLDDPDAREEATHTTFLADRDGNEFSLLRSAGTLTVLPGPAEGRVPDLCRRVLGLPTAPAPPSTNLLWTLVWLDRIMERWAADPGGRLDLARTWPAIAALHPAAEAVGSVPGDLADTSTLVSLVRAHARDWPWARLRAEPDALPLPGDTLPVEITEWMDDGFFARWALGAFPHPVELVRDLVCLLDEHPAEQLARVFEGLLLSREL